MIVLTRHIPTFCAMHATSERGLSDMSRFQRRFPILKGAPPLSHRSWVGQGGDFDFLKIVRKLLPREIEANAATASRAEQSWPHPYCRNDRKREPQSRAPYRRLSQNPERL